LAAFEAAKRVIPPARMFGVSLDTGKSACETLAPHTETWTGWSPDFWKVVDRVLEERYMNLGEDEIVFRNDSKFRYYYLLLTTFHPLSLFATGASR